MNQTDDKQGNVERPERRDNSTPAEPVGGQILIYRDGSLSLQVRLDGQTVWLTQKQLAEFYQTTVPNINQHLKAVYEEGELAADATIKQYLIVQTEGSRNVRRQVEHYSLDVILAVGYRVRSARGTQFRQWATSRLRELLVKGFVLDDERIKVGRTIGQEYFDELLARIRDIRASERLFYQKIADIYATSINYDPGADIARPENLYPFKLRQINRFSLVHSFTCSHRRGPDRSVSMASATSRPLASMMSISSSGVRVSTTGFLCGLTALRS